MESLNGLFRKVIFANELDNNLKFVVRFSDPDGVRTGKSGWSFGICQFDTRNNDQALACLRECGFTIDEIDGIVDQTIDVKPLATKLAAHSDIIARYDEAQLSRCINQALNWDAANRIPMTDTGAILACADYVNQYGSQGESFAAFFKALNRPIIASDILDFKLAHTKYGREHPQDCGRRYKNLMKVLEQEGLSPLA